MIACGLTGDLTSLGYGTLNPFCVMFFCVKYVDYGIKSYCAGINLIRDLFFCGCVSLMELGAACRAE